MNIATLAKDPFIGRKRPEGEDWIENLFDDELEQAFSRYVDKENILLNPRKLDILLQYIILAELDLSFFKDLVQNSFNNGYNNFILTTYENKPNTFLSGLKGNDNEKIKINIQGDLGINCFSTTKYCEINVDGNVGQGSFNYTWFSRVKVKDAGDGFGIDTYDSTFYLDNVGDYCGVISRNSTFKIRGDCGIGPGGKSKDSLFIIAGKIPKPQEYFENYDSNSTFLVTNHEVVDVLKEHNKDLDVRLI